MGCRMGFRGGALTVIAAAAVSSGCVIISAGRFVEREDKRFAVEAKPRVWLSTFDGSIDIRSSDRHDVSVSIEKHAHTKRALAEIEVETEQTGDRIVVDVRLPKVHRAFGFGFFRFHDAISARLIVTVPEQADVQAHSGDGHINIQGVTGTVDLQSGDGRIVGRDLAGAVKARTGDGSVKLDRLDGAIDVDTGDGTIVVSGRLTGVLARSGDGTVTIRAAEGSKPTADWDIKTGDGSVVLELPDGFSGEIDAHTGDGLIRMRDIAFSGVAGRLGRSTVRGRLGNGGHAVRLRTGDGTITLARSSLAELPGRPSPVSPER